MLFTNTFFVDGGIEVGGSGLEGEKVDGWISDLGELARGRGRAFIITGGFQRRMTLDLGNVSHNIDVDEDVGDVDGLVGIHVEEGAEEVREEL
ncbi:hypothetical protein EON65_21310 [archaeon]|nr:MAG: hypothetical protein EON65_21310 [archaeon]